ncbi:MAG TPA: STAS domain-containing protein [Terriglobia bacterium]|nr:STAS domain-containing protein [Terriglobia bacterium]
MPSGAIPILKLGSTLLATIQIDLHDTVVDSFQNDVLEEIERTGSNGLIIDISALETVDSYVARMLANTGKMAKLMGTDTVIVGMRPAVAATLVRMGYYMEGIETALSLEEGLQLHANRLKQLHPPE